MNIESKVKFPQTDKSFSEDRLIELCDKEYKRKHHIHLVLIDHYQQLQLYPIDEYGSVRTFASLDDNGSVRTFCSGFEVKMGSGDFCFIDIKYKIRVQYSKDNKKN